MTLELCGLAGAFGSPYWVVRRDKPSALPTVYETEALKLIVLDALDTNRVIRPP